MNHPVSAAVLARLLGSMYLFWTRATELARTSTHRNAAGGVYSHRDRRGNKKPPGQRATLAIRHIERLGALAPGGHFPLGLLAFVDADLTPEEVNASFQAQETEHARNPSKNKRRFDIAQSGRGPAMVRVFQGHTNDVPAPPELLVRYDGDKAYHGTNAEAWRGIQRTGLKPMNRHAAHMSVSPESAAGYRPKSDVTIVVDVARLREETSMEVYRNTGNDVLLCIDVIPPRFLSAA
eukprot:jgi/Tetstr1/447377/TSEL_034814.t1